MSRRQERLLAPVSYAQIWHIQVFVIMNLLIVLCCSWIGRIIRSICILLCPRHRFVFQAGLKTGMYYLRTRAAADAIKFTVDQQALAKNKAAKAAKLAINPGAVSTPNPLKVWLHFHNPMIFEVLIWIVLSLAWSWYVNTNKQACQHATPFWEENYRSELMILQERNFERNQILQGSAGRSWFRLMITWGHRAPSIVLNVCTEDIDGLVVSYVALMPYTSCLLCLTEEVLCQEKNTNVIVMESPGPTTIKKPAAKKMEFTDENEQRLAAMVCSLENKEECMMCGS